MWESPTALWRRLKLGREEYLQRLVTTLILDGVAPPWNMPHAPGDAGRRFLGLLDEAAHGSHGGRHLEGTAEVFVDEYLLPKLEPGHDVEFTTPDVVHGVWSTAGDIYRFLHSLYTDRLLKHETREHSKAT